MEKNGTQCFESGSNDNWDNKSVQDESNVIINTDQKGSCLSPRQRISEMKEEADQSKIETVWFGQSETNERDPCVLFSDELSRLDNKGLNKTVNC